MMMSPEAARGLCGGGSDCTCRPPLHPAPPHIPTYTPSTPSSGWEQEHSCAGRQSRRRRRRKRRGERKESGALGDFVKVEALKNRRAFTLHPPTLYGVCREFALRIHIIRSRIIALVCWLWYSWMKVK